MNKKNNILHKYKMQQTAKYIIIIGIILSILYLIVGYIVINNSTEYWIQDQINQYQKRLLLEYFLLCIIDSLTFGFGADYILRK